MGQLALGEQLDAAMREQAAVAHPLYDDADRYVGGDGAQEPAVQAV